MSSLLFIVIRISKFLLLRAAKAVGDRVVFLASDSHIAALKFLNPQSYDLREISIIGTVCSDELGDYCKRLGGINSKVVRRSEERLVTQAVEILLASQMYISLQQVPYFPSTLFLSLGLGPQPSQLASPLMNLTSRGH